jgi:hypothetical protein
MKKFNFRALAISAAFAVAAIAPMGQAQAVTLLGQPPDPSVIVSAGGMEWVYAAPCAAQSPSCGIVTLSNGFNFATGAQWTASWASISALSAAFAGKCAATYFSNFHDHCDFGDTAAGWIWHSPLAPDASHADASWSETFLVRDRGHDVPEPASLALVGLGLIGFAAARRRKSRA